MRTETKNILDFLVFNLRPNSILIRIEIYIMMHYHGEQMDLKTTNSKVLGLIIKLVIQKNVIGVITEYRIADI